MSSTDLPFNTLDENEFQNCFHNFDNYEPTTRTLNNSPLYEASVIKEINARTPQFNLEFDTDLTHTLSQSKYITVNQFKSYLSENLKHDFSLLHCNIRSMNRNFDSLKILLDNSAIPLSIIGITETWITDYQDQNLFSLPHYKFESNHTINRHGGGVACFISNEHEYSVIPELTLLTECVESLFIHIKNNGTKDIVVGIIYRPPNSNLDSFFSLITGYY